MSFIYIFRFHRRSGQPLLPAIKKAARAALRGF